MNKHHILDINSILSLFLTICGVLFLLIPLCIEVLAQDTASAKNPEQQNLTEVRPGSKDKPVPVKMGLIVVDIDAIDGANQLFVANFGIIASWKDPRLAKNVDYIRTMDMDDVWTPNIQILNQQKLFQTFPERVEVLPDGTVYYTQRYWGTLSDEPEKFPARFS